MSEQIKTLMKICIRDKPSELQEQNVSTISVDSMHHQNETISDDAFSTLKDKEVVETLEQVEEDISEEIENDIDNAKEATILSEERIFDDDDNESIQEVITEEHKEENTLETISVSEKSEIEETENGEFVAEETQEKIIEEEDDEINLNTELDNIQEISKDTEVNEELDQEAQSIKHIIETEKQETLVSKIHDTSSTLQSGVFFNETLSNPTDRNKYHLEDISASNITLGSILEEADLKENETKDNDIILDRTCLINEMLKMNITVNGYESKKKGKFDFRYMPESQDLVNNIKEDVWEDEESNMGTSKKGIFNIFRRKRK